MGRTVPFISPILFRSFINRFLPFPARCGRWSRTALWNALPTLPTAARRWCVAALGDYFSSVMARLEPEQLAQMEALRGALMEAILAENAARTTKPKGEPNHDKDL